VIELGLGALQPVSYDDTVPLRVAAESLNWEPKMPVISTFLGIIVRMYHDDHNPPHVHVQYGEFEAIVEISTGRLLAGRLPPRVRRLLGEWLRARRAAVTRAWHLARQHRTPPRIRPLD
jgi:hypothetical protein